jgi:hypothetical protein
MFGAKENKMPLYKIQFIKQESKTFACTVEAPSKGAVLEFIGRSFAVVDNLLAEAASNVDSFRLDCIQDVTLEADSEGGDSDAILNEHGWVESI